MEADQEEEAVMPGRHKIRNLAVNKPASVPRMDNERRRSNPHPVIDPEPVERGERNCEECGKPHNSYRRQLGPYAASWADPEDGHPYRPESWEKLARRLLAREGRRLAIDEHADALRELADE